MTDSPLELVLVRHGESVRNHASDLAHHGDLSLLEWQMRNEPDETVWPLTDAGHEQARKAGEWIRANLGARFDAAYLSPFVRTRQTAEDLGLDVSWRIDDRLREREWGDYTLPGLSPYLAEQYLDDLSHCSELGWRSGFPGGESVVDMMPRVMDFLEDAVGSTPRGRILAVTHGGTIRAFQAVLERLCAGPTCPDHRLSNCCVVIYRLADVELSAGRWTAEVKTAHPCLPNCPETGWQPITAGAPLSL